MDVCHAHDVHDTRVKCLPTSMQRWCPLRLQVGVKKAHQMARQHNLKLVPVHHMEAHALVARLAANVQFPFLCMLVSGGHNMLLVAHAVGDYTLMGSTLDDSVGQPCIPYNGFLLVHGCSFEWWPCLHPSAYPNLACVQYIKCN